MKSDLIVKKNKRKRKTLTLDQQFDHIYELYFEENDFDENDVVSKKLVLMSVEVEVEVEVEAKDIVFYFDFFLFFRREEVVVVVEEILSLLPAV